jgi:hypothetical protein
MHRDLIARASALSDEELLGRMEMLAGRERRGTVELVAHLAEVDSRKLHVARGYGSLFNYCTGALRLAEHAAYNRIEAARVSRRYPQILDLLADGSMNLSTVRLLAPHLTRDNHQVVLAEASHRSKRAVEELVARLSPQPDAPVVIRRVPSSRLSPLAPERYSLQCTIGQETHDKLRRIQELLRREVPDGDPGSILDRAFTLLLADLARRKLGATSKPKPARAVRPRSRYIPAGVKRAVTLRDEGRCTFVAPDGRRCSQTAFLEWHHLEPYARGGKATVANVSLRCRAHNQYEAILVFGPNSPRGELGMGMT